MKRRDLLKAGALAAGAGVVGCAPGMNATTGVAHAARVPQLRRVRNVIFLIYDGTGYEDMAAAGHFSRRVLNRPFVFERLLNGGATGSMWTSSLTSIVTDSSAASTVFGTGRKITNVELGMLPDGTVLTSILDLAKGRGMMTGLVTTTRATHATPAGFVAKISHRDREEEIAAQYLDFGPDVLLGGGSGPFNEREDKRDLFEEFRRKGYDVLRTTADLERTNASKLVGIFSGGMDHCPYEIDRRYQGEDAPSLAQMTRKALDVLAGAERGFVVQVEAGRIDLANHYSDPGGMIWDWVAADDALAAILDFVDRDGETLLIMACDHETAGSVVYGTGPWFSTSSDTFQLLEARRASNDFFMKRLGTGPDAATVEAAALEMLGIALPPEQVAQVVELLAARPVPQNLRLGHRNAFLNHPDNSLNQILSTTPARTPTRPNIAYATGQHTAGLVPAVLYGPMVQQGGLGVIDNTELFTVMTQGLGFDFENPMMTEEQARRLSWVPAANDRGVHT
ncbi:MAG TPA: alkaline phosphatase [Longimicrobiales bacterium]|nr:alkaline phosphatase [Longimicrobiales bacterium]